MPNELIKICFFSLSKVEKTYKSFLAVHYNPDRHVTHAKWLKNQKLKSECRAVSISFK